MADENKIQKINPLKQFEQQVAVAKNVKDILKIDIVKNRYIANFTALTGRSDGLQVFEQEAFAFIDLVNTKPEIMECDPFSIVAGLIRASTYGLSFSGNDLSVYPRGVKQKDGSFKKALVVEPQAHGKKRLLARVAGIKKIDEGVVVYKDDTFAYSPKLKQVTKHEQKWPVPVASEDTVIAAYCTVHFEDGHTEDVIVNNHRLKAARAASKMTNGGDLWIKYYEEACKKTTYNAAFKVHWKKPETAVLFQQWEAPDDQPETQDITSEEVDPTVISPSVETETFNPAVNEQTGEVYPTEEVKQKKQPKPKKEEEEPFV